ncbi:MAG: hypothetical protein J7K34_04645, partial [Flavobacteriaceae bacterium]|nr:hypothetical protein [Flavobacteriaceae bacterium]
MKNKLFLVAILILISIQNKAQTKIIAHRGFSEIAPENTLIAFQKAIEIGADYFELDVHQTKDGVLVVIHDKTVDRTSSNNKKGDVKEKTFKELGKVKVGLSSKFGEKYSNEKIPTLKEALQLAKGKIKVCVELKADNIENQIVELLNELDMINQVIVFAFNDQSLVKIKNLNPEIKTLFLKNHTNIKTLDFVKEIHANAIGVGYDTKITKEFILYAHKN